MLGEKVRRFMPGEGLNTIFSARQLGLALASDIIKALEDLPIPSWDIDDTQSALDKWRKKWFSDFIENHEDEKNGS